MIISHTAEIRVRYADTDQMHFAYNGKYLEYFEVGRTELIRSTGLTYREFEQLGFQLPLAEAHLKYHKPALYDDLLLIETTLHELPLAKMRIDYRVLRKETNELLTEGYTLHAFLNTQTQRPVRCPQIFLDHVTKEKDAQF